MSSGKRNMDDFERKLFAAWKSVDISAAEGWRDELMREVQSEKPGGFDQNEGFGKTAWRLAIAAGVAAFLLLAHSLYSGIIPDMDLSALFVLDPGGCLMSPPFSLA
ncbi:MAG: hypothetical protein GF417_13280 [Candidatus Latescibacteria bacterium]|nr:hypothetical protein [bacterium]MBD3425400.1 hypothetical protein [Candidatus Latescibacterota bacterium]